MRNRSHKRYPFQTLGMALAILGLAACGGGADAPQSSTQNTINSGGAADDCITIPGTPDTCSNPPVNNAGGSGAVGNAADINRNNAAEVANAALSVIDIFYGLGERQGVGGDIVISTQGDAARPLFSLAGFARDQLAHMAGLDSLSLLGNSLVVGIHVDPLVPCAKGSVENNSVDPDVINARFTDCELDGVILNGDLTIEDFRVDPSDLTALFTFTGGLSIDDGVRPVGITSGAMRFSARTDASANVRGLIRVESPLGLSYRSNETVTVQNQFTLDYEYDLNTSVTTINANGGITRSGGAGNLTVATQTVLSRPAGAILVGSSPPGPYDGGRLRVMSSDTSSVTLEILSSTEVFLDINDGADSLNMSWAALLGS